MCDALNYLLDNIFKDLAQNYIEKLQVFQWVLIVLLLLQICFCFVTRETSCCLCQTIIKLIMIEAFNSTSKYLDELLKVIVQSFINMHSL